MKGKPHPFRTRARLINQLGEQLIKNESIALLELIKNSYDADASRCVVIMHHPEEPEKGQIIIKDNGEGMDYDTLSTAWMEIGTSYKDDLRKVKNKKRTEKYKRNRLGEKGIGRLGVHRLGREIEIITRKDAEEYIMTINWDDIEDATYIEDLYVFIKEREPQEFISKSGTKITIKRLRVPWTRKMARDCARSIMSLNSPFESNDSFRVKFKISNSDWLKGLISFDDIKDYKLFSFDVLCSGNYIDDFIYEFTPWETMNKLKSRCIKIDDKEISSLTRMVDEKKKAINLDKYKIGNIKFKGMIFDRDTKILEIGVQDKKGFKEYLDNNGGIRVFRDNMRVFDYGEPGNDWLNLGGRRINIPTKSISNNIILGAIYLDAEKSIDLIEKANREGFVANEAYYEFISAVNFVIQRIESLRQTDKNLLRKYYGPRKTSEPVTTSISELKIIVDREVKQRSTKEKINRYLDSIEEDYEKITESLLKGAGAGLNLIMAIHQSEKIIKDIKKMINKKVSLDIIEERVEALASFIEGYGILVKSSEKKKRNLKDIIEQCIFNMAFRFDAHKIRVETEFREKNRNIEAVCSVNHVLSALMNLFDNSIWWLGYGKTKNPEIYVDISDVYHGYISILVADNGPGFSKPTAEIIKPFVTDKPGGMGIGLYSTNLIMEMLGGKLLFPEMEIFDFPEKYEKGAKIALAFRKGES